MAEVGIPAYVTAHSDKGVFIGTINVTPYADFLAAYNAGKAVYAKNTISPVHQTNYFPLVSNINGTLYFACTNDTISYQYKLTSAGAWTLNVTELQPEITANGILKGNGAGGVSAAEIDTEVTEDSDNLVTSGAVFDAISAAIGNVDTLIGSGVIE